MITCVAKYVKIFFLCNNLSLQLINIVSSNMQPKHVTFEYYLIYTFFQVVFSFRTVLTLSLEAHSIDLVLSLRKLILSLLPANHSQMFVKSSFNCFSFFFFNILFLENKARVNNIKKQI